MMGTKVCLYRVSCNVYSVEGCLALQLLTRAEWSKGSLILFWKGASDRVDGHELF